MRSTTWRKLTLPSLRAPAALAALLTLAAIIAGSLHPFAFGSLDGMALERMLSAGVREAHGADVALNLLLYLPPALLAAAARGQPAGFGAFGLGCACGFAVSTAVEVAQALLPLRTSSLLDVGLNAVGAGIGAALGARLAPVFARPWSLGRIVGRPAVALLLGCFFAYRLYPYVPVLAPDQVWAGVYYAFDLGRASPLGILRGTVAWLMSAVLLAALTGRRRARLAVPVTIAALAAAEIIILRNRLVAADLIAAMVAVGLWAWLPWRTPPWASLLAILGLAAMVATRLRAETNWQPDVAVFWIPFAELNWQGRSALFLALFETAFRLGAVLWLFHRSGLTCLKAVLLVAAFLLGAEMARIALGWGGSSTNLAVLAGLALLWSGASRDRTSTSPAPLSPTRGPNGEDTIDTR